MAINLVHRQVYFVRIARATRRWDDAEWATALERLAARGWAESDGSISAAGAARLSELILPIHAAIDAVGTYAVFA
jgi:hypothetical protein